MAEMNVSPGIRISIHVTSDTDGMATREYVKKTAQELSGQMVKQVNGESPDESGNVQVSGLPEGAGAHQQLVTDANGNAVWEERTHYRKADTYNEIGSDSVVVDEDNKVTWGDNDEYFGYESWTSVNGELDSFLDQLVAGKTYKVVFDNEEYLCIAEPYNSSTAMLGNKWLGYNNGADTGEPFYFICWDGWCYYFATTGEHTITISEAVPQYSPLPEAYLDEAVKTPNYDEYDETALGFIKNRPCYYTGVNIIVEAGADIQIGGIGGTGAVKHSPHSYDFIPGYTYRVVGTAEFRVEGYGIYPIEYDFTCVAKSKGVWWDQGGLVFSIKNDIVFNTVVNHITFDGIANATSAEPGNSSYDNLAGRVCMYDDSFVNSSEPDTYLHSLNLHCYAVKELDPNVIPSSIARVEDIIPTPTTASIGQTIVVKAVDEDGKPTEWEAADPMIIASSTEGSTKKFKLTVDDTGAITATEVTE